MTGPLYHVRLLLLLAAALWLVWMAMEKRQHPLLRVAAVIGAGTLGALIWVKIK